MLADFLDFLADFMRLLTDFLILFQVYSRSSEDEPCGWWLAKIKMVKGDFFVVDYIGWESTYSEIVQIERIRKHNTK